MTDESKPLFEIVESLPPAKARKSPSAVKRRLIDASVAIQADDPESILYQHTVFCQTGLPYRDPGKEALSWERLNGCVHLKVYAGEAMDPEKGHLVQLGLPWGSKPRLILAHLNAEALRTGSPVVEVDASLTAFVKRLQLDSHGRNMRMIKDQLARLSASRICLGIVAGGRALTINSQVVTAFDIWFPKDARQRVLWPNTIQLSHEYFESLQRHAVPLDDRAIAALSHSAMGLDIYSWLAQRLHRVDFNSPQLVTWAAVKAQFGWHYKELSKFKQVFRKTLTEVLTQYRAARIEMDDKGLTLCNSPPPVKGRIGITSGR